MSIFSKQAFFYILLLITHALSDIAPDYDDHNEKENRTGGDYLQQNDSSVNESSGISQNSTLESSISLNDGDELQMQIEVPNIHRPTQSTDTNVDPEISQLQVEYGYCRALNLLEVLVGVKQCTINQNTGLPYSLSIDEGLLIKSDYEKFAKKIKCVPRKLDGNETIEARVQLVNSSHLFDKLGSKNDTHICAVVLFYAPWCPFCAETAPHYNALARSFAQIDVLAIDAVNFSDLRSRFGTIAVPNILVFHNSKAVARYNSSERTLDNIVSFVANVTGLEPNKSVKVISEDYEGPLPSIATQDTDILLWFSWIFIFICFSTAVAKSSIFQKVKNYLGSLGNIEHQHID